MAGAVCPELVVERPVRCDTPQADGGRGRGQTSPGGQQQGKDIEPGFARQVGSDPVEPSPCKCHQLAYVFSGHRPANGAARHTGREARRHRAQGRCVDRQCFGSAERASLRRGADPGQGPSSDNSPRLRTWNRVGELAAHWCRTGFATWLFPAGGNRVVPAQGAPESSSGADPGRTLARGAHVRPERCRSR